MNKIVVAEEMAWRMRVYTSALAAGVGPHLLLGQKWKALRVHPGSKRLLCVCGARCPVTSAFRRRLAGAVTDRHSAVMASQVTVRTGARLHFGLLAVKPLQGRKFGGVGVMIDQPGCHLRLRYSDNESVTGNNSSTSQRVREFLAIVRSRTQAHVGPVEVEVLDDIPSHGGLGSGTQLGLAVAAGLEALTESPRSPAVDLARHVGRGARSAIGVHGFDHGGFLIEAGHRSDDEISPLVARVIVPDQWRWLLISPREAMGLSGAAEQLAFGELASMPESLTNTLCRILLMDWLPAMLAADFLSASEAMWAYGQHIGQYFASVQGSTFANPQMERLAHALRLRDVVGIAQTSWGPTIAVLCADDAYAAALQEWTLSQSGEDELSVRITASRNSGAEVLRSDA
ncbi:MAG: hypothetical protein B7Z55_02795 [Planctomycetales bacterium 12-60-4]|nr:MAG: hypothetical protein B7Z55_02795 [Planctomycetales bacterium 12-60-4]